MGENGLVSYQGGVDWVCFQSGLGEGWNGFQSGLGEGWNGLETHGSCVGFVLLGFQTTKHEQDKKEMATLEGERL
jgi:hypothetical protein